ncbi:phosphopantetheine-binding protein [Streptomyces sp. NPDC087897]|uniref:phosphopantetheine-binding protein n=1 Tax=Streptomyces sp. NPDC087897 TaxID=3365817 RepID=UPI003817B9ED
MNDVQDRFYSLLSAKIGVETESLTEDTTLESLDLDSLLLVEVSVAVEKEFGVVLDELQLAPERTVGEVLGTLDGQLKAAS